jgi:hypothetical protein
VSGSEVSRLVKQGRIPVGANRAFSSWRSKGGIVARVKKRLQLFCGHVNTSLTNSKLVKL